MILRPSSVSVSTSAISPPVDGGGDGRRLDSRAGSDDGGVRSDTGDRRKNCALDRLVGRHALRFRRVRVNQRNAFHRRFCRRLRARPARVRRLLFRRDRRESRFGTVTAGLVGCRGLRRLRPDLRSLPTRSTLVAQRRLLLSVVLEVLAGLVAARERVATTWQAADFAGLARRRFGRRGFGRRFRWHLSSLKICSWP